MVHVVGGPFTGSLPEDAGTNRGRGRIPLTERLGRTGRKWRSLWMSDRGKTSGCAQMASYHHVVPAFWTPIPTKSGGPVTSSLAAGGGVGSNASSHGAYLPKA